jgi:hypothetical protein
MTKKEASNFYDKLSDRERDFMFKLMLSYEKLEKDNKNLQGRIENLEKTLERKEQIIIELRLELAEEGKNA